MFDQNLIHALIGGKSPHGGSTERSARLGFAKLGVVTLGFVKLGFGKLGSARGHGSLLLRPQYDDLGYAS